MVMPWLLALLLLAAVGVVLLVLLRPGNGPQRPSRDAQDGGPRRLANSVSLFDLPQVRSRITHRRWLHAAMAGLIVVALVAASAIAARPVREVERTDRLANRDIVLCLDVSTSMVGVDASVLKTFADLVESFDGERVALVAWNSSAQTIVPLTDDYELLQTEMEDLADVLDLPLHHLRHRQPGHRPLSRADLPPARRHRAARRAPDPPVLHLRSRRAVQQRLGGGEDPG